MNRSGSIHVNAAWGHSSADSLTGRGPSNLAPARRGFFARLRDLLLGRGPAGASARSAGDPISTLRPAAGSGVMARLRGRTQGLSQQQSGLADRVLASIRTDVSQQGVTAAPVPGQETSALVNLARQWRREWPDQVFDLVSHQLRTDPKLKQALARELQASSKLKGWESWAAMTGSMAQAMGSEPGSCARTQSQAQALMAAVLGVLGEEKAAQQIAELRQDLKQQTGDQQRPIQERLERAVGLLARANSAAIVLRTAELDAFRTEVRALISNIKGMAETKKGALTLAIGSLRLTSTPLAERIDASLKIGTDLAQSSGSLDPVDRVALQAQFNVAVRALNAECDALGAQALALSDSLDQPQDANALAGLRAGLTHLQAALDRRHQLTLSSGEPLHVPDESHVIRLQTLEWAARRLAALERPVGALDCLGKLSTRPGHQACADLVANIQALRPADYLRVSLRLQALVDGMDPHRMEECLVALADMAQPDSSGISGRSGNRAFSTTFVQALTEDPAFLAALLPGTQWREEVTAFRLVVLDELEHGCRIGDHTSVSAANKFGKDFEAERIQVDAQHHQAVASDLLDQAFGQVGIDKSPLPRIHGERGPLLSAFRALVPSPSLIRGLFGSALPEGFAQHFDMQILDWVRLSAAAGLITQSDIAEIYAAFPEGSVTRMGPDAALQWASQGFRSTAEVLECTGRIRQFASQLTKSKLAMEARHKQRPLEQAGYALRSLYQEVTGETLADVDEQHIGMGLRQAIEAKAVLLAHSELPSAKPVMATDREKLVKELGLDRAPAKTRISKAAKLFKKPGGNTAFTPLNKDIEKFRHLVGYLDATYALSLPELSEVERKSQQVKQEWMRLNLEGFNMELRGFFADKRIPEGAELAALLPQRLQFKHLLALEEKFANPLLDAHATASAPKPDTAPLKKTVRNALKIAILLEAINGNDPDVEGDTLVKPAPGASSPAMAASTALGLDRSLFRHSPTAVSVWTKEEGRLRAGEGAYEDLGPLSKFAEKWNPSRETLLDKVTDRLASTGEALPLDLAAEAEAAATPDRVQSELSRQMAQSFRGLKPGGSFGIRLGIYGEATVSAPVLPGASVEFASGFESAGEITIHRRNTGEGDAAPAYEVTIAQGKTVRSGVSLHALNDMLSVGVVGTRSAGTGLHFQFDDASRCQQMLQSLLQGVHVDPLEWQAARIDRSSNSGRSGRVEASIEIALHEALFNARASMSGELESRSELIEQGQAVVEVLTRRMAGIVEAQVTGGMGRLDIARERGSDLSVTRRIVREGGQLRGDSELIMAARVVDGRVQAALRDVLPDLPEGTLAELTQQVGVVDASSQVILRCLVTPLAMSEVNKHLRAARSALIDAMLQADGAARAIARSRAAQEASAAEVLLQKPSSYRMDALLVREASTVRQEGLPVPMRTAFAQSSDTTMRQIPLPAESSVQSPAEAGAIASGDGAGLTAGYSPWLTLAPSSTS